MDDHGNKHKAMFLKVHHLDVCPSATNNMMKNLYMNNEFNLDTFMVLQDQKTDKTYLFYSHTTDNHLRVIQMKTSLISVICKDWDVDALHPVTRMQYYKATKGTSLFQVHPNFTDVVNNGQFFTNENKTDFSKIIAANFRKTLQPPKYFEEFICESSKY